MYQGKLLPNLTDETPLYYLDMCLTELIRMKDDEKHMYDENLLAAAITLRFCEQVDGMPWPSTLSSQS
jgi:hypothetical protein